MLLKELNNLKEIKVIKELIKRGNIFMIELGVIADFIDAGNEMMKRYGYIPKRFLPLSSVLLGILAMVLIHRHPIFRLYFYSETLKTNARYLKIKT